MKKLLAAILCLLVIAPALPAVAGEEAPLRIVCTTFPQYDWIYQILGGAAEGAEVTLLLDSGADLHSYQPTAADIAAISACDLFVYVGGESDTWVDGVLAAANNPNMIAISVVESVEAKEEEMVEGMQEDEGHDHHHGSESFEDGDVADRALSDFAGEWQSIYPYLMDGTLDEMIEHKAEENPGTTFEAVKDSYAKGYETDIGEITIEGDQITFIRGGASVTARYTYEGFVITTSADGHRGVRYQFAAAEAAEGAPKYVQFNDHNYTPEQAEHFHAYFGDESFDALLSGEKFPTYFPTAMGAAEIAEEMSAHGAHEEETEYDEHVWLSLKNAQIICGALTDALCELDPANAGAYRANAESYGAQLARLDGEYGAMVEAAARKTVLFADRFPFRYLADDYGLTYYAAFAGCSAETEASFATIAFLVEKVDELELPAVLVIDGSDHTIAQTVVSNSKAANQQILEMDSLQSVTASRIEAGASYLAAMEANLAALKIALN